MCKIVAFIQMYNEATRGNLIRCLENCKQWADDIAIYDDASTDNSVDIASRYTEHIIRGKVNDWGHETYHKQELMQYVMKNMAPDWIMWVDCDEILDRSTTTSNTLRQLCEINMKDSEADAFAFQQINMWRSETYYRTDAYFYKHIYDKTWGWFVRLWRVTGDMSFKCVHGGDMRLFPVFIENIQPCDIKVLHYGFANYKSVLKKIGVWQYDKKTLLTVANGQAYPDKKPNWIIDECALTVEEIPREWFPIENIPTIEYIKPTPKTYDELIPYSELV